MIIDNVNSLTDQVTKYSGDKLITYQRAILGGTLEPYQAAMIPTFSLKYLKEKVNKHYANTQLLERSFKSYVISGQLKSYDPVSDTLSQELITQGPCIFIACEAKINYRGVVRDTVNELRQIGSKQRRGPVSAFTIQHSMCG